MATLFLIVIYLSFISLGLPDSLLGVAWPIMQPEIGASFGSAGIISMIIAGGTIVSSLVSGSIIQKLGTGQVTLISCLMTAGALLGFSVAPSLFWFAVLAIPLGLGAGAVDSALNHYVASHYKAHHMSWLHSFWGVGAMLGPIIMSYNIADQNSWRQGYWTVAMIQFGLVVGLFITLPLWKRVADRQQASKSLLSLESDHTQLKEHDNPQSPESSVAQKHPIQIKGVKYTLVAFLFYCSVEATVGLWGASYLVGARSISAETAASWVSLYYGGITLGRFMSGFITMKVSNRHLILIGQLTALVGGIILLLPLPNVLILTGFILIGLGLAPIFPGLLHETPARFGKEQSAKLMGYQMAAAYTGTTFLPPIFGLIASNTTIKLFPVAALLFIFAMLVGSEKVIRILKAQLSDQR
ncbi:putative transporter [compost metagenome]